jgi:hypothetical protein
VSGYEVLPRYSCGSPAMVDERTAQQVIRDEQRSYKATLEGFYGAESIAHAEREGLEGIVLIRGRKDHYTDAITGRDYGDMPYGAIRHPDSLVVETKGGKSKYYFRRQLIGEWKREKHERSDENFIPVMRRLQSLRELFPGEIRDVFAAETHALWRDRRQVR